MDFQEVLKKVFTAEKIEKIADFACDEVVFPLLDEVTLQSENKYDDMIWPLLKEISQRLIDKIDEKE